MTSKRMFEEKIPNIKKVNTNLEKFMSEIRENLKELRECSSGSAFETMGMIDMLKDRTMDDLADDIMKKINTSMENFSKNFEYFRSLKGEVEVDERKVSENIKKLYDNVAVTIERLIGSRYLTPDNFIKRLQEINKTLEYSWKAALPYQPPKLTPD